MLLSKSGPLSLGPLKDLLLDIAEARDSEALMPLILRRLTDSSEDVVLACIWLLGPGDACAACRNASVCPSREECLHLAATSGSIPVDPKQEDAFRRVPMTTFDIGRVLTTDRPIFADATSFDMPAGTSDWARAGRIRSFWGVRIARRATALGVLGVFLGPGEAKGDDDVLRLVASQIGIAVANERTSHELQQLRHRLQTESGIARLRSNKAVLSEDDVRRFERENILAALEATKGRVYGRGGAAELLGLKPTTLASRLKKLGIAMRT